MSLASSLSSMSMYIAIPNVKKGLKKTALSKVDLTCIYLLLNPALKDEHLTKPSKSARVGVQNLLNQNLLTWLRTL